MKKTLIAAALVAVAGMAHAEKKILPEGTMFCASASAYREQLRFFASDIYNRVPGCGEANKDYQVFVDEANVLSAAKLTVLENGATVYTDLSFIRTER